MGVVAVGAILLASAQESDARQANSPHSLTSQLPFNNEHREASLFTFSNGFRIFVWKDASLYFLQLSFVIATFFNGGKFLPNFLAA